MRRLCCYDDVTLDEVMTKLKVVAINKEKICTINVRRDPQALWSLVEPPQLLILSELQQSDMTAIAKRLAQIMDKDNPLCFILGADLKVVKALMRLDQLREAFSSCPDIDADLIEFRRELFVSAEESYEF